jgi:hypothetical protein
MPIRLDGRCALQRNENVHRSPWSVNETRMRHRHAETLAWNL